MAAAVMTLNVVGISKSHPFAREGTLRSPGAVGCESPDSRSSSASLFCGTRIATACSPRDSKSGGATVGARAYAATEENVTAGFGPVAVTKTLYDLLGVSNTATPKEIKTAYRLAARRLHPDVVPEELRLEATKTFLEVQEIYSILSDHRRRAAYDLSLSMQSFNSVGFSNRGPVAYSGKEEFTVSTPSWGFTSPISSRDSYSSSPFSFKGRNWETDQCW